MSFDWIFKRRFITLCLQLGNPTKKFPIAVGKLSPVGRHELNIRICKFLKETLN